MTEKKSLRIQFDEAWLDFRKQMTWNNIKGLISGVLPLCGYMYLYSQWIKLVGPLLDEFSKSSKDTVVTVSQHDALLSLCVLIGFVAPLFLCFPVMSFGFWLGRITKFYIDKKTIYLTFDDTSYYLRDMSQEQRDKIAEILCNYKSKLQLRKEERANWSWLRRNFS